MPTNSQLLLPSKSLAGCVAGCIFRDTRGVNLSAADRMNYFPASPLYTVTLTLEGQIHIADSIVDLRELENLAPAPKRLFQSPKVEPHVSWNPGPLVALTIAIYPDAWLKLGGTLEGEPPEDIEDLLSIFTVEPLSEAWRVFCDKTTSRWNDCKNNNHQLNWFSALQLKDWAYHLFGQITNSDSGSSIRSVQRKLQQLNGFNRKELEFYAKMEEVHRIITVEPDASPAQIAIDSGFSDQSHMGRAIKRATGFSPIKLNQRISTEEPFWCYRLLGKRF